MKINQNLFEYSNLITDGFAIISAHDHQDADERLKKALTTTDYKDWVINQKIGISFINNFLKIIEK